MKNLAGDPNCNEDIEEELLRAKIKLVRGEPQKGEVPTNITGVLGRFKLERYWTYWVVSGDMPLEVARELYRDPIGKRDIRVAGHCGCPPPKNPWIKWKDSQGREIYPISRKPKDFSEKEAGYQVFFKSEDLVKIGKGFITSYHIDTGEGLRLFADTVRKHKLF